jgi:hypothetical protein
VEQTYTTAELLQVSGLTETSFRALVARGHFVPSAGKPGTGYAHAHSRTDVLQARILARLRQVGVPAHRAALFWPLVLGTVDRPNAFLILAPNEDDTDTIFRLVREGEEAAWDHHDAPAVAAVVNIGAVMREVMAKLKALRGIQ